jgi:TolB-like protein
VVAQVRNLARSIEPAPFVLETVPKVGFRLIAPGAGEAGATTTASASPRMRRRGLALTLAGIAVLILIAGSWTLWRYAVPHQQRFADQNGRVDVMTFEPSRPDPELQRLSSTLSDALVRTLSSGNIPTAQHPLRRDDGARGGDAEFRLAGSVDRDGDNYVVNGQILDRKSGLVLWSGRIERPVAAATGFTEDVAQNVSGFLQCALEERRVSRTRFETEVFGLYLNACWTLFGGGGGPERMLGVTRRLVQAGPDVAAAHAMHGIAAALVANSTDHSPDEVIALRAEARAAAARALKLDPRMAKAYVALALAEGTGANWDVRERNLQRALKIDPELPGALFDYIGLLREVGRTDEAIEAMARMAHSANSRLRGMEPQLALMRAAQGDLEGAEKELSGAALPPGQYRGVRWTIAVWWEEPSVGLLKVRALGPEFANPEKLGCLERYLADLPKRKAAGTRGLAADCAGLERDWRVRLLAREGDLDGAYAALATPMPNSRRSTYLFYYPEMKAFRADPRFMPLAKRMGLLDYWVKSNRWPDFCAEPDLPYDCRTAARALVS